MKQLPCIKQYVLDKHLKTIKTRTNNLTDTIFSLRLALSFDILTL